MERKIINIASLMTRVLSTEEQDLVDKLSEQFLDYKKPRSKEKVITVSKKEKLTEYNLVVLYRCKICSAEYITTFHMKWCVEQAGLVSCKVDNTIEGLRVQNRVINLTNCKSCKIFLMGKDKEFLIDLILGKQNDNRNSV